MARLLVRRAIGLVSIALVASLVVFLVPFVTPGDPARKLLRARLDTVGVDDATAQAYAERLGLDRPPLAQFGEWLVRFASGDMGISYTSQTPVADRVLPALGVTVSLAAGALLLALVVAAVLGVVASLRRGGAADRAITATTHALIAIPEYAVAPVLVLAFSVELGLLPSAGWRGPDTWVLPMVVLSLRPIAFFTAALRSGLDEALQSEHVVAARARGLGPARTFTRHVVPHGVLPLVTLLGVWFAGLLGGSVIVESIFAIPGMGRLMIDAVRDADIPLAQGAIVVTVVLAVLVTSAIDVLHRVIDPALRSRGAHG